MWARGDLHPGTHDEHSDPEPGRRGLAGQALGRSRSRPTGGSDRAVEPPARVRGTPRERAPLRAHRPNSSAQTDTAPADRTEPSWQVTQSSDIPGSKPQPCTGLGSCPAPLTLRDRPEQSRAAHGSQKILVHGRSLQPPDRRTRHQDQPQRLEQIVLMEPERLAQKPAGSRTVDRIPYLPAGHDPQSGPCAPRQSTPVRNQAAANHASPLLTELGKLARGLQTRLPRQSKGSNQRRHETKRVLSAALADESTPGLTSTARDQTRAGMGGGGSSAPTCRAPEWVGDRGVDSDRRQPLPPHPASAGQGGLTPFG